MVPFHTVSLVFDAPIMAIQKITKPTQVGVATVHSLNVKVATWFRATLKLRRCTCPTRKFAKPKKPDVVVDWHVQPIALPRKYANNSKPFCLVSGWRVPLLPSHMATLKQRRNIYAVINEEVRLCVHCQDKAARQTLAADDDAAMDAQY
ncbi:Aste57867_4754 [Aphanomyces stellatus]|uniref:Aste57867_4754 protein n=1 Tax=Aphanomyces stellatus TaxID=120398 RepID=A0A485KCA5_9STRA|nr:hypothetical protein As57867_004741 [Aphanomyces stellatus]VFT81850.1 Aste57867_4754 [Aphanomyces stellatus]